MTEQERINQQFQRQIDAQNSRIDTTLSKVDIMIFALICAKCKADFTQRLIA